MLVIVIFLIVLALLWFTLPFAVFCIKKRIDTIGAPVDANIAKAEARTTETDQGQSWPAR